MKLLKQLASDALYGAFFVALVAIPLLGLVALGWQ